MPREPPKAPAPTHAQSHSFPSKETILMEGAAKGKKINGLRCPPFFHSITWATKHFRLTLPEVIKRFFRNRLFYLILIIAPPPPPPALHCKDSGSASKLMVAGLNLNTQCHSLFILSPSSWTFSIFQQWGTLLGFIHSQEAMWSFMQVTSLWAYLMESPNTPHLPKH